MSKLIQKPHQLFALLCVDNAQYTILKAKMFHAITKTHLLDFLITNVSEENRHQTDFFIHSYHDESYRNGVRKNILHYN